MSDGESSGQVSQPKELSPLEEICARMTMEQRYKKFLGMLHDRKMSIEKLSIAATKRPKSRTHVNMVLQGKRPGECTWARLVDHLTHDELVVLGKKDLIIVSDTIKSST